MKSTYRVTLLLAIAAGCALEPADTERLDDSKQNAVVIGNVTSAIKAARSESAATYRDALTRIADDVEAGRIVYDTKLQLELSQAGREAGLPIANVLAKHLPTGKITDPQVAATTLRQIRDGYQ